MFRITSKQLRRDFLVLFFLLIIVIGHLSFATNNDIPPTVYAQTKGAFPIYANVSGPLISEINTNETDYVEGKVPKFNKFEISFQIQNTVAGNFQLPFDPNPPNGIDLDYSKHQGISVDALFLPPGETDWNQAYQQPAFYYQVFDDQIKKSQGGSDREWYYPTGEFTWKVRFSPNEVGLWQFKLKAQDASGYSETDPQTFTVIDSSNKGFIKVSSADARYFEFDNGTPFHGIGFQESGNFGDPVLKGEENFQTYQQNGINFLRIWISSRYGPAWLRYLGGRNIYDGYLPRPGLLPIYDPLDDRSTMTMRIDYEPEGNVGWFDACRFQFWDDPEAVKQNTDYRIRIKYRGVNITGPRNTAYPNYGFVGKIGDWHPNCHEPGTGTVVTNYGANSSGWEFIEGSWNSGSDNFLPRLYMGLENVNEGKVYIDSISIQEDLGNGKFGPNIMIEPSMEYELYFSQEESYALDKLINLAEKYDIYLKLSIMERNDKIYYKINDDGDFILAGPDNLDGFYGVGRIINKTRWLQQAWWRYLQARWGYSTSIHSWELTNEGDPLNQNHYALTDELGKFMHCRVFDVPVGAGDGEKCEYDHPIDHLVTTSFWQWFPADKFWANSKYPNVDYADVHAYVSTGWLKDSIYERDAAAYHIDYSADTRRILDSETSRQGTFSKPIVRGEAGIGPLDEQVEHPDLSQDHQGVWLHNYLWATLHPGALVELYWWKRNLIDQPGPDNKPGLYEIYGSFANFIESLPLNNGNYQGLAPTISNGNLRVVGQKDLINQKAHLWIQNKQHTWRNVVDGVSISPQSGTVTLPGFRADQGYVVQWFDTLDSEKIIKIENIVARTDGNIELTVSNLDQDIAAKIFLTPTDFVYLPVMVK